MKTLRTMEGLMKTMYQNNSSILGIFDEFSTLLGYIDKWSTGSSEKGRFCNYKVQCIGPKKQDCRKYVGKISAFKLWLGGGLSEEAKPHYCNVNDEIVNFSQEEYFEENKIGIKSKLLGLTLSLSDVICLHWRKWR